MMNYGVKTKMASCMKETDVEGAFLTYSHGKKVNIPIFKI
jgi:hypothetical protein